MARRLSPNVARDPDRGVRVNGDLGSFGFLTLRRSHDRAFLDAVATDIIHQHSGRLDYYKGYFISFASQFPSLRRMVATSPSSTQLNPNESETCGASTMHRWSIASIYRLSLTVGGIMPTVLLRHSPKLKFSRRSVGRLQLPAYLNRTTQLPELSPPTAEETESFRCVNFLSHMGFSQHSCHYKGSQRRRRFHRRCSNSRK
jgi:hypothetical protein